MLGANVDGPEEGTFRVNLMVGDVTNNATGAWLAARRASFTFLDVNHFGWVIIPMVLESEISDAAVVITRND